MMSVDANRVQVPMMETSPLSGQQKRPDWESTVKQNGPQDPDQHAASFTQIKGGSGGGLSRAKKQFSLSDSDVSLSTAEESETSDTSPHVSTISSDLFGHDVRLYTRGEPETPDFTDNGLRKNMEPYIRKTRKLREKARKRTSTKVDECIASSMGVPYTALRGERPFLFDENTHPLHTILADTLNIPDLSRCHEYEQDKLLLPLLDPTRRHAFHSAYDSFVTSFCIPLLHSMALEKNIFDSSAFDNYVTYRYQAFPTIRIVSPGSSAYGPICDTALGHSIGCLSFHIPLTPAFGTNALYVESHPGREDWHPLNAKSVGLGYLFDGARCLHFGLDNTTSSTRVSLDFRVLMYRENAPQNVNDGLTCPSLVEDRFSQDSSSGSPSTFYDEALMGLARSHHGHGVVVKKNRRALQEPDFRVGPPFAPPR